MEDLYQLGTPEGRGKLESIARIVAEKAREVRNEFLKFISGNETLTLDACDGAKILAEANDVFKYIDSDLKSWGADQRGRATTETPAEVYEMEKDATFSQMFSSLTSDVRRLCLTQNQIIGFAKKHRNRLRTDGYGTFFLFESNGEIFVASVRFASDDLLRVGVGRFEYSDVWNAENCHRLVTPKLIVFLL
ncbi:MAG: hypothetical protein ACD_7C00503G0018 [uncultured bacterium]|nr:MAG: hypothetical protein ACD_7C00503G0018 [uncultured bacterium]HBR79488.1 hypothetical protein [Candidatus Moranbacteria bacterium]